MPDCLFQEGGQEQYSTLDIESDQADVATEFGDIQITNKNIIHAKLRNQQRELTPFLSGERFVYIKAGVTRALPSVVDINHNKCRIFHPSQEKSCNRCRYTGHCSQNTELCNAYTENSDIISIRSQNNVMSNFYQCVVTLDGIDFKSSEHAYQWRLAKYFGRDDLAQDILEAPTPGRAKELTSQIQKHLNGSWHEHKLNVMKEILMSKAESCKEFRDALIESRDKKLVETVKSDRFWSCGLTPLEAQTTKPLYYPGENHLGRLLELVRDHLINQTKDDNSKHDEQSMPVTSPTMERSNSLPHLPIKQYTVSNNDISTYQEASTSSCLIDERSEITPRVSTLIVKCAKEKNTEEIQIPPPPSPLPPQVNFSTPSTKRVNQKKSRKITSKSMTTPNPISKVPDEKGNLMLSWVKRKLSPGKESDTTTSTKMHKGELST